MTWNLLRHSFSLKGLVQSSKKSQRKKKSLQRYRANALRDNYMENIIKCSHPKMTGKTRVWPVKSTIRLDIVRWLAIILSPHPWLCQKFTTIAWMKLNLKSYIFWSNVKKSHLSKQKELFPKAVNTSWSVFRSVDKSAFWLQDIDISTALVVSMKWT